MEAMTFTFHIHSYDANRLLPQASRALEKRTELLSRARYPRLWNLTDAYNQVAQKRTRTRLRTRSMSVICLLLGIFLFVPGLTDPKGMLIPLLSGAVAIGAGIGGLWSSRKNKRKPFDDAARTLLDGKDTISEEPPLMVSFSDEGMFLPADDGEAECVPYSQFECVIETPELFLLVYDTRVTLLQKADLTEQPLEAFGRFLSGKVAVCHAVY